MRHVIALFLVFALGWCEKDLVEPSPYAVPGPHEVVLSPGESVVLPGGGSVLTFMNVPQDSRCPLNLRCFWAGDGAAWLKLQGDIARDCTLHTTLDPKTFYAGGVHISLRELAPYPVTDTLIDPSEYRVTLALKFDERK